VAYLDLVIQVRDDVEVGETVGYANAWTARDLKNRNAVGGYADGLTRALSAGANLWHGAQPVPLVGRVSMDLITADTSPICPPGVLSVLGLIKPLTNWPREQRDRL
jgi:alanine racemase